MPKVYAGGDSFTPTLMENRHDAGREWSNSAPTRIMVDQLPTNSWCPGHDRYLSRR